MYRHIMINFHNTKCHWIYTLLSLSIFAQQSSDGPHAGAMNIAKTKISILI